MNYAKLTKTVAVMSVIALAQSWVHAQSASSGSSLVGAWSNVQVSKGEDPHASGVEVEIRQKRGELVGFCSEYVGPVADPPVGKLESIRFDEKTGQISFTSKLSVGVVPAPQGNTWMPSKNLYEFKGEIGKAGMTGMLRRKYVDADGKEMAYEENVTLAKKAGGESSLEEWMKRWTEALKTRGPKW
jgi:hypothetical protein